MTLNYIQQIGFKMTSLPSAVPFSPKQVIGKGEIMGPHLSDSEILVLLILALY